MNDDERLKQTFDKLRADDARRMPSFEAVTKKRRPKVSILVVAIPVVTMAAALLLWFRSANEANEPSSASFAAAAPAATGNIAQTEAASKPPVDEAPLDFLLDVPLLRGTPNFDSSLLQGSVR